jgi:hypothetical protein
LAALLVWPSTKVNASVDRNVAGDSSSSPPAEGRDERR